MHNRLLVITCDLSKIMKIAISSLFWGQAFLDTSHWVIRWHPSSRTPRHRGYGWTLSLIRQMSSQYKHRKKEKSLIVILHYVLLTNSFFLSKKTFLLYLQWKVSSQVLFSGCICVQYIDVFDIVENWKKQDQKVYQVRY